MGHGAFRSRKTQKGGRLFQQEHGTSRKGKGLNNLTREIRRGGGGQTEPCQIDEKKLAGCEQRKGGRKRRINRSAIIKV